MKKLLNTGFLTCMIGVAAWHPASYAQGFTGVYAPINWTLMTNGGDGAVSLESTPISVSLTGNNAGGSNVNTDYVTTAAGSGAINFSWTYTSSDDPGFDGFGYLLRGSFTTLSNRNGQSGTTNFDVNLDDTFGFRVFSTDGIYGPGSATISNFSVTGMAAPTPVPGPLPLLGVIAAFGFSRRLRARIHAARPA